MKKRYESIDIAKGIGIFLVVLGHTTSNEIILKWLYSFHMPLFFFVSGLFHSKTKNYKEFFLKKTKVLLIPYFCFAIMLFLFFLIISKNIGFSVNENLSIKENFIAIFIGTSIDGVSQMSWGGQLWFLLALFLVANIMYFVDKFNFKAQILINFFFIELNIQLSKIIDFNLPWSLLTVLMAFNFYWSAEKLKKYILEKEIKKKYIFIFLVINLLIICFNSRVEMYSNIYGNRFLFILGAYSGILFIIFFSKEIVKRNRLMEYIGKNSIVVLAFHRKAQTITKVLKVLGIYIESTGIIYDVFYSVWQILLCVPLIIALNKYFPFILGKGNKKIVFRKGM